MAAKKNQPNEPTGYADAMREVESIIAELDSNSVDVDVLATKVERASFLINWCNERITAAQLTVDSLVATLSSYDDEEEFDDEEYEDEDDE
jgi:exodeoxyribonuclease VII small subunit